MTADNLDVSTTAQQRVFASLLCHAAGDRESFFELGAEEVLEFAAGVHHAYLALPAEPAEGRARFVATFLPALQEQNGFDARILEYLTDQLGEGALLKAAGTDPARVCSAWYYIGALRLAHSADLRGACAYLRRAAFSGTNSLEQTLALVALTRTQFAYGIPGQAPTGAIIDVRLHRDNLRRGEFVDPLPLWQTRFADAVASTLGGDDKALGCVVASSGLAMLYEARAADDAADHYYRVAVDHARQHSRWDELARALRAHGLFCMDRQDSRQAFRSLRELDELVQQHVDVVHHTYADDLNVLAISCEDPSLSESYLRRALALLEAAGQVGSVTGARLLDQLAAELQQLGRLAEADDCYERARRVFAAEGASGQFHLSVNRFGAAGLARRRGELERAEAMLTECVELRRASLHALHDRLGTALAELGAVVLERGRPADASVHLQAAVPIAEATFVANPGTAFALFCKLISSFGRLGDRDSIEGLSKTLRSAVSGGSAFASQRVLLGLTEAVNSLEAQDALVQAEQVTQLALQLAQATPQLPVWVRGLVLGTAGMIAGRVGNYADGVRKLTDAIDVMKGMDGESPDGMDRDYPKFHLANLYRRVLQPARAVELLSEILERSDLKPGNELRKSALRSLAGARYEAQDPMGAASDLTRALSEAGNDDLGERSGLLADLANVHGTLGNYQAAFDFSDQARKLLSARRAPSILLAWLLINRAGFYRASNKLQAALAELDEARALIASTSGDDGALTSLEAAYGSALVLRGRPEQAFVHFATAVQRDTLWIERASALSSEGQRLALIASARGRLEHLLWCLSEHSPRVEAMLEAATFLLRRKSLALEMSVRDAAVVRDARSPEQHELLRRLNALRKRVADGAVGDFARVARKHAQNHVDEMNRLEAELALQSDAVRAERSIKMIVPDEVVVRLPKASCAIDWVRFESATDEAQARYGAFIYEHGKQEPTRFVVLPTSAHELEALISEYLDSVDEPAVFAANLRLQEIYHATTADREKALAERLGRLLFEPLSIAWQHLTRILISPDAALHTLPFCALIPRESAARIVDLCEVQLLNTLRDLDRAGVAVQNRRSPLVVGAPRFDWTEHDGSQSSDSLGAAAALRKATRARLEPLPGAGREVEFVAGKLKVDAVVGERALKSTLASVRSPLVLHIATHAIQIEAQPRAISAPLLSEHASDRRALPVDDVSPLARVALTFAGAGSFLKHEAMPAHCGNGLLTGIEARQLDLSGCALCVLSACESGVGRHVAGEGTFSLARAFVLAGARAVVVSLWKQHDEATHEFMSAFYSRLVDEGLSVVAALAEAQRTMRSHPRYAHPFYWAGWSAVGQDSAIAGLEVDREAAVTELIVDEAATTSAPPDIESEPIESEMGFESVQAEPSRELPEPPVASEYARAFALENAGFRSQALDVAERAFARDHDRDASGGAVVVAKLRLASGDDIVELVPELERLATREDEFAGGAMQALAHTGWQIGDVQRAGAWAARAVELSRLLHGRGLLPGAAVVNAWRNWLDGLLRHGHTAEAGKTLLGCLRWALDSQQASALDEITGRLHVFLERKELQAEAVTLIGELVKRPTSGSLSNKLQYVQAVMLREQGRAGEAASARRYATSLALKHDGPNSAQYAAAMHEEAVAHVEAENMAEAERCLSESLRIQDVMGMTSTVNILVTMRVLADAQKSLGKHDRALPLLERALRDARAMAETWNETSYWRERLAIVNSLGSLAAPAAVLSEYESVVHDMQRVDGLRNPLLPSATRAIEFWIADHDDASLPQWDATKQENRTLMCEIAAHAPATSNLEYLEVLMVAAELTMHEDAPRAKALLERAVDLLPAVERESDRAWLEVRSGMTTVQLLATTEGPSALNALRDERSKIEASKISESTKAQALALVDRVTSTLLSTE